MSLNSAQSQWQKQFNKTAISANWARTKHDYIISQSSKGLKNNHVKCTFLSVRNTSVRLFCSHPPTREESCKISERWILSSSWQWLRLTPLLEPAAEAERFEREPDRLRTLPAPETWRRWWREAPPERSARLPLTPTPGAMRINWLQKRTTIAFTWWERRFANLSRNATNSSDFSDTACRCSSPTRQWRDSNVQPRIQFQTTDN